MGRGAVLLLLPSCFPHEAVELDAPSDVSSVLIAVFESGEDPRMFAEPTSDGRLGVGAHEGGEVFLLFYKSTLAELGLDEGPVSLAPRNTRQIPAPTSVRAFVVGTDVEPSIERIDTLRLPSIDAERCLLSEKCVVRSHDPDRDLICGPCAGVIVTSPIEPRPPSPPVLRFEECFGGEQIVAGISACRSVAPSEPCSLHQMHLPATPGCEPVGSLCGPWPAGADRYVDASAVVPGDGTMGLPFPTLGEGIASLPGGGLIQLSSGSYGANVVPETITIRGICPEQTLFSGPVRIEGALEDSTVAGLTELRGGDLRRVVLEGGNEALRVEGVASIHRASIRGEVTVLPGADLDVRDAVVDPESMDVLVDGAAVRLSNARIIDALTARGSTVAGSLIAIDRGGIRLEPGSVLNVSSLSARQGRIEVLEGSSAVVSDSVLHGLAVGGRAVVRATRFHHDAEKAVILVDGGRLEADALLIDGDLGKAVTATRGAALDLEDIVIIHEGSDTVVILEAYRSGARLRRMHATSRGLMMGVVARGESTMVIADLDLTSGSTTTDAAAPPIFVAASSASVARARFDGFGHGIEIHKSGEVSLEDVDLTLDTSLTGSGVLVERTDTAVLERIHVTGPGSDCLRTKDTEVDARDFSGLGCGGLGLKVDGGSFRLERAFFDAAPNGAAEIEGMTTELALIDVEFQAGGRGGVLVQDESTIVLERFLIEDAVEALGMVAGMLDMTGGVVVRRASYALVVGPTLEAKGLALLEGLEVEDVAQVVFRVE